MQRYTSNIYFDGDEEEEEEYENEYEDEDESCIEYYDDPHGGDSPENEDEDIDVDVDVEDVSDEEDEDKNVGDEEEEDENTSEKKVTRIVQCGDEKRIKIVGPSGKIFWVEIPHCKISRVLDQHIKQGKRNFGLQCSDELLEKLTCYFELCGGTPGEKIDQPIRSSDMTKICKNDKISAAFINDVTSKKNLIALAEISIELQIDCLSDLCSAKIASLIKGSPAHTIPTILKNN